jgi:predicted metal-binding protein
MSMRVFLPPSDFDLVENQAVKNSMKREFLINYDKCLLWASDKVIEKLNEYILLQKMQAKDETSVAQEMLKKKHTECFLEMRKDCGFADTKIGMDAYQFVTF